MDVFKQKGINLCAASLGSNVGINNPNSKGISTKATIDTFNIKNNYIYLPMLFMMIISILDNFFKFNAMPAKITIKSYYGSAVLPDKICLIYSSQFYSLSLYMCEGSK